MDKQRAIYARNAAGRQRLKRIEEPAVGVKILPEIAAANPGEVFVNPGADSPELFDEAKRLGVNTVFACAIVDIGESPSRYS